MSASTDAIYKPVRGVVFASYSVNVVADQIELSFYADRDGDLEHPATRGLSTGTRVTAARVVTERQGATASCARCISIGRGRGRGNGDLGRQIFGLRGDAPA